QHALTNSSQSSSSSQTANPTPNYLISGILDIILKLLATADDLQPIAILIPLLNEMKINGEKNIKKKTENILFILLAKGINSHTSENSNEKDEKIHLLEDANRNKDDIIRRKDEQLKQKDSELQREKESNKNKNDRIRTSEEQTRASDERVRLSEQQKLQIQEQLRTKDSDIQRLQNEITQLRQIKVPSSATHSTSVIQPVIDQNTIIEDNKSELENPDPTGQGVRLERIQDLNRKAVALKDQQPLSVSLNKVIKDGIHRVEVRFEKCNGLFDYMNGVVGILKANYQIPYPCAPGLNQYNKNMLNYDGRIGGVFFKGTETPGNVQFSDGQLIAMELNADKGTLHFFVDGIQQPVFVKGINEAVKFYFWIYYKDSSFKIETVKKLSVPTTKTLPNEKAVQW
ncbi:MAG: hypothetical protein EZS28_036017, partial [Streblomastix strix]